MQIDETRQGAVTVVRPTGPLVLGDAEQFRTEALGAVSRSLGRLVIDASGVPYVDSRGLEAVLDLADELAQGGQALRVCGAQDTVREVLDLTEASSNLEFFDDLTTAVRSFL